MSDEEKTRVTQVVQGPLPEGPGNDCLVVIYAAEQGLLGKRYVLDKSPQRVGRGADNQIVLEGDSVSRRHAELTPDGRTWFVRDIDSANGTFVNGEKIGAERVLFETDFPHPTCLYPNSRRHLENVLGDLPDATRRRVLHDNAAELYRIAA